jgi:hypothetical protein
VPAARAMDGAFSEPVFGTDAVTVDVDAIAAGADDMAAGAGTDEFIQAAVGSSAGDGTPPAEEPAGTVISSPQAGHFAVAKARLSDVVNSLPHWGQLNSIATLRPRSSLLP